MKYTPPPGSVDPDAPYVTGNPVTRVKGSPVPAEAVENPQREIVKVIQEAGLVPSNADLSQLYQALQKLFDKWNGLFHAMHPLCGLHFQLEPDLPEGFEVWDGGVIENGAELYPEAWQYLQSTPGQKRCISQAERNALANHTYYTLADGTDITYDGIGGVPFYSIDMGTGKIVMPDIRGMHIEAAGLGSLGVGGVAIDQARVIFGSSSPIGFVCNKSDGADFSQGVFVFTGGYTQTDTRNGSGHYIKSIGINSARTMPVGDFFRPRSLGILACSYMGKPAL